MSVLKVRSIRHDEAASDAITIDNAGNVVATNSLTVNGTNVGSTISTLNSNVSSLQTTINGLPESLELISSGTSSATVSAHDFTIDVTKYTHYVMHFDSWATSTDGSTLYFDILHSSGSFNGWYGGNHAVGEANGGSSNAFSDQAYALPFSGQTTAYLSNTYRTGGRVNIAIASDGGARNIITWQLVGRFSGGSAQHCVGGCLTTTSGQTATAFRMSMNYNTTYLTWRWYGVKA
jgi:hypothetical protein